MNKFGRSSLAVLALAGGALAASCIPDHVAPTLSAPVVATASAASNEVEGTNPGSSIAPETTDAVVDWWGVIRSTEPGAQYDDYFERQDLGQVMYFGIDSMDPAVRPEIQALRDSGRIVHLYGRLLRDVPDYGGAQIQVDQIEVE